MNFKKVLSIAEKILIGTSIVGALTFAFTKGYEEGQYSIIDSQCDASECKKARKWFKL